MNMPLVLNTPGFWTSQGSEYTKVLNTSLVLNLPGFWICQGYTGFWICLNMPDYLWLNMPEYAWICLNMSGWICLNMPEYTWICLNMPGYAWICLTCLNGFCFIFPRCNPLSTWRRGYLFQRLHKTRSFSLNENETVFLETHNLI